MRRSVNDSGEWDRSTDTMVPCPYSPEEPVLKSIYLSPESLLKDHKDQVHTRSTCSLPDASFLPFVMIGLVRSRMYLSTMSTETCMGVSHGERV
jgi:uncharacterized Zn-finger protein